MSEMYDEAWCRRLRKPRVSMKVLLTKRELGWGWRKSTVMCNREFAKCLVPGRALPVLDRPQAYTGWWSADGTRLVSICMSFRQISIHEFRGAEFARTATSDNAWTSLFFPSVDVTVVRPSMEGVELHRDVCLITHDSQHAIVVASVGLSQQVMSISSAWESNESLPLASETTILSNYHIYTVDLKKGVVCDEYRLEWDRVNLPAGVSLVRRALAVLSVQHQNIHLFHIQPTTGDIVPVRVIGTTMYDDDQLYLRQERGSRVIAVLSGLKQKLLTFLYKRAKREGRVVAQVRSQEWVRRLKMWEAQLVDKHILLVRMVPQDQVWQRGGGGGGASGESGALSCCYVMVHWQRGDILEVYERYGPELLSLWSEMSESLLWPDGAGAGNGIPVTHQHCANITDPLLRTRAANAVSTSSPPEQLRRVLTNLPLHQQCVPVCSPFLDPSLFHIDDRVIAAVNTAKIRREHYHPIRLAPIGAAWQRHQLELGSACRHVLFHPHQPFALSCDRGRPRHPMMLHVLALEGENEEVGQEERMGEAEMAPPPAPSSYVLVRRGPPTQASDGSVRQMYTARPVAAPDPAGGDEPAQSSGHSHAAPAPHNSIPSSQV